MADDDDWFGGGEEDAPREIKPLGKKAEEAPPAVEEGAPPSGGTPADAPEGEEAAAAQEEALEDEYLDPDKLLLFKHWIRPKFLPYKCIYEYRKNYYDDIMEVISSRRRGIKRDIPPAQTWAERMCRLRSDPLWRLDKFDRHLDDVKLVTKSAISGDFYNYFSKEQFNKRYSKLLY